MTHFCPIPNVFTYIYPSAVLQIVPVVRLYSIRENTYGRGS